MEETALITEQNIRDLSEQLTPVKLIESTLASFLNNTFQMAIDEDDYQKDIKNEIRRRLPDFKNTEIIALSTSAATNKNDLISKLVAPTMQLLTAAQQNELAQKQREATPQFTQNNIKEINANSSAATLAGLTAFMNLLEKLKVDQNANAQLSSNSEMAHEA